MLERNLREYSVLSTATKLIRFSSLFYGMYHVRVSIQF